MMAVNLQTSYMHPPLGPTLFFLRGVAPPEITTRHIYVGDHPVRADPALRAGGAVVRAGACDRAAADAVWRVTGESMKPNELFDLTGRVALVTGASSGLGVRFAEVLAANGAKVVLVARRADRLAALRQKIEDAGGQAIVAEADVLDRAAMVRAFDAAEKAFGTVTILVNNAGVDACGPRRRDARGRMAARARHQSRRGALLGAGGRAPHDRGEEAGRDRQHRVDPRLRRRRRASPPMRSPRPAWCSSPRRSRSSLPSRACASTRSRRASS